MYQKINYTFKMIALAVTVQASSLSAFSQGNWKTIDSSGYYSSQMIKKKKFTLVFINKDSVFSPQTSQRMIDAFFKVYPKQVKRFNRNALNKVTFIIDPQYKGVAATAHGIVRYSPDWLTRRPEDIDVVTHEAMHIVQDYAGKGAGWMTEGIADYVRYKYGVNNIKGNWALPPYKEGQHYTNSYRVTARFLAWLEIHSQRKIVDSLDKASREGTYTEETWRELTGKTVEELWKEYTINPAL